MKMKYKTPKLLWIHNIKTSNKVNNSNKSSSINNKQNKNSQLCNNKIKLNKFHNNSFTKYRSLNKNIQMKIKIIIRSELNNIKYFKMNS